MEKGLTNNWRPERISPPGHPEGVSDVPNRYNTILWNQEIKGVMMGLVAICNQQVGYQTKKEGPGFSTITGNTRL